MTKSVIFRSENEIRLASNMKFELPAQVTDHNESMSA